MTTDLAAERGLATAARRLGSIPFDLPAGFFAKFAGEDIDPTQITSAGHALVYLRGLQGKPDVSTKREQLVGILLDRLAAQAELFAAFLWKGARQLYRSTSWRRLHPSFAFGLLWVWADRLTSSIASCGVYTEKVAEMIRRSEPAELTHAFRQDGIPEWFRDYAFRIEDEVVVGAMVAAALQAAPLMELPEGLRTRILTAIGNIGETSWFPKVPITFPRRPVPGLWISSDPVDAVVQSGTTTEKNLTDFSKQANLNIKPVVFDTQEATNKAYFAGRCQAYTTDASGLASVRNKEATNPDDHLILPELISKEPLGPSVRRGDDEFFAIVKWVTFALIEAEEYGITQANVDQQRASTDPAVLRLLGVSEDTGKLLGLDRDWAVRAIKAKVDDYFGRCRLAAFDPRAVAALNRKEEEYLTVAAKDMSITRNTYNARSETVAEKPSFRDAWKKAQHCIIPAQAIYEPDWRSGRPVFTRIERADGRPMGIAGLWSWWRSPQGAPLFSFTMLTVNADQHGFMRDYHEPEEEKRMVVILPEGSFQDWLDARADQSREFLQCFPADLLQATGVRAPRSKARSATSPATARSSSSRKVSMV